MSDVSPDIVNDVNVGDITSAENKVVSIESVVVSQEDDNAVGGVSTDVNSSVVSDPIPPTISSVKTVHEDSFEQEVSAGYDGGDETDPVVDIVSSRGQIPDKDIDWFTQPQYILFSNELKNIKKSNLIILKECKEAKRLLDLKYGDLTDMINRIQTSVILLSTISGFFNATKIQFGLSEEIISVMSISISTYVSLVLSVSKYFKYDESKEGIQALREKFSMLHNQIEHRMDVLGPWNDPTLWKFSDPDIKLSEWDSVKSVMHKEYNEIIKTKQALTTEFEIIMDTKSRNLYHISNKQLTYSNRQQLFKWAKKEMDLEDAIESDFQNRDKKKQKLIKSAAEQGTTMPDMAKIKRRHTLFSNHELMEDNWDNSSDEENA